MKSHAVSYERLLAFASGELAARDASEVEAHLTTCEKCSELVARYRAVQVAASDAFAHEPPAATVDRARSLFRRAPDRDPAPGILDRIIATLTLDTRGPLALAGVRGRSEGYQLAFESSAAHLDLQLFPPSGEGATDWHLLGQVEETGSDRARAVRLVQDDRVVAAIDLDDDRLFDFGIPAGSYELEVELPRSVVVLRDIEVP